MKRIIRTLGAEELARDVEVLATDNDDLLAAEQLLGDYAGQAAKEVALAIDDDLQRSNRVSNRFLRARFARDAMPATPRVRAIVIEPFRRRAPLPPRRCVHPRPLPFQLRWFARWRAFGGAGHERNWG